MGASLLESFVLRELPEEIESVEDKESTEEGRKWMESEDKRIDVYNLRSYNVREKIYSQFGTSNGREGGDWETDIFPILTKSSSLRAQKKLH